MKKNLLISFTVLLLLTGCSKKPNFSNKQKIEDYFYKIDYTNYDWDFASSLRIKILSKIADKFACSAFCTNGMFCRNFDLLYGKTNQYVIKTEKTENRHASLGVSFIPYHNWFTNMIFIGKDKYKILPFFTVDGINDSGLCVCVNYLYDKTENIIENKNEKLNQFIFVRYLLDFASSVDEAVQIAKNHSFETTDNCSVQFLVSDSNKTVVIEIVGNNASIIENENVITNFYHSFNHFLPHSQGIERYNLIKTQIDSLNNQEEMHSLLKSVYFSKFYHATTLPRRYSDFNYKEITRAVPYEAKDKIFAENEKLFKNHKRDFKIIKTLHSSIYNIENRKLSIFIEENEKEYNFEL